MLNKPPDDTCANRRFHRNWHTVPPENFIYQLLHNSYPHKRKMILQIRLHQHLRLLTQTLRN